MRQKTRMSMDSKVDRVLRRIQEAIGEWMAYDADVEVHGRDNVERPDNCVRAFRSYNGELKDTFDLDFPRTGRCPSPDSWNERNCYRLWGMTVAQVQSAIRHLAECDDRFDYRGRGKYRRYFYRTPAAVQRIQEARAKSVQKHKDMDLLLARLEVLGLKANRYRFGDAAVVIDADVMNAFLKSQGLIS